MTTIELSQVSGVQQALKALGYGDASTRIAYVTAVRSYQRRAGLRVDGVDGPITQASLSKALARSK